jgi:flavin-dependent dehydrogenase
MNYDVIIVGAGSSGLMSAYQLSKKGKKVLVVEQGKNLFYRKQKNPFDVANGIGDAGFFSDGKFSFFPSASNLWKLDTALLNQAYEQFRYFLNQFDIEVQEFDEQWNNYESESNQNVIQKHYDSIIVDLPTRFKMIFALYDGR